MWRGPCSRFCHTRHSSDSETAALCLLPSASAWPTRSHQVGAGVGAGEGAGFLQPPRSPGWQLVQDRTPGRHSLPCPWLHCWSPQTFPSWISSIFMLIKTHLIPKQLAVSPRAPPPETQVVLGVEKGTVGDGQLWLHLETGEGELVSQASPGGKRELRVSKTSLASRPKRGLSRATSAHQSRPLRGQAGWKERDRRTGRQTDGGATQASRVARGRSTVRKFFPPQNFFFR